MIDETFASRWIDRLRKDIPGTRAIILKGSHARGQAGPHSDIDFDVLTESGDESYRAYLEPDEAGRLIHVSVAVDSVEAWLADEDEPASWSFG
ncbi:MAG TPA: nucleotidyltransferase domain-containing protein, partial [Thermomicrobiales bacterium]|nr:nucleotidyltransferase domain-containing protein [Thermomicrobiales bacterium]